MTPTIMTGMTSVIPGGLIGRFSRLGGVGTTTFP